MKRTLKESVRDIKNMIGRIDHPLIKEEDTKGCNTSKDYYNYINNIADNDGKTTSWEQFWGNIIRKLKDDNGIDTTKENVCACLKQNDVYKGTSGKSKIDKMCK